MLNRISSAEGALQAGRIITSTNDGTGSAVVVDTEFDFRPDPRGQRMHSKVTRGKASSGVVERLIIGNSAWQRGQSGLWQPAPLAGDARSELARFLPGVAGATGAQLAYNGGLAVLTWDDAPRGALATLTADANTGVPLELRLIAHSDSRIEVVGYKSWNVPPPEIKIP